jgi:hypothetical protein
MRLQIELPTTWAQQKNTGGPATFCRRSSSNAFQVSWAEYRGKQSPPGSGPDDLTQFAINFGIKNDSGELLEFNGGSCRFGNFGTAVFRSAQHPRLQIWVVSNGSDRILATHICSEPPDQDEIVEAQQIASTLALGPEPQKKSIWKFW